MIINFHPVLIIFLFLTVLDTVYAIIKHGEPREDWNAIVILIDNFIFWGLILWLI